MFSTEHIQQSTLNIQLSTNLPLNFQPSTLASQARHEMGAPSGECASRSVVNLQPPFALSVLF
jgi:hypothetical protein